MEEVTESAPGKGAANAKAPSRRDVRGSVRRWPWEETGEQGSAGDEMQRRMVQGLSFPSRTTRRKPGIRGFQ